jgi:hypothetical protein
MMASKEEVWTDRCLVMMETRNLVPLLQGKLLEQYQEFLKKPEEYRQYIYEQVIRYDT